MHAVNCGDHYAHFDRSINQLNYLRFSEREWRRWNNSIQYQNRLRPSDFARLIVQTGLELVVEHPVPHYDWLSEVPVHPEFQRYSGHDLACSSYDFVARKPKSQAS
jgi:hypothetical protein